MSLNILSLLVPNQTINGQIEGKQGFFLKDRNRDGNREEDSANR